MEDNAVEDLSFNVIKYLELSPVETATATLPHWSGCSTCQVSILFVCSHVYPHHGRSHHHPACCRCPWAEKGNLRTNTVVHKTLNWLQGRMWKSFQVPSLQEDLRPPQLYANTWQNPTSRHIKLLFMYLLYQYHSNTFKYTINSPGYVSYISCSCGGLLINAFSPHFDPATW